MTSVKPYPIAVRLYKLPQVYACSEDGIDGGFYVANKYAMGFAIKEMQKSKNYYCADYSNGGHGCILELDYKDYFKQIKEVEIDNSNDLPVILKFLKNNNLLIDFPFELEDMIYKNDTEHKLELEASIFCILDNCKLKTAVKTIVEQSGSNDDCELINKIYNNIRSCK
jgi:hypothetical protein